MIYKKNNPEKYNSVVTNVNESLNGITFGMFEYVQNAKEKIGGDCKIDFVNKEHRKILGKALVDVLRK